MESKKKKNNYTRLKRKLYWQAISGLVAIVVFLYLLRQIVRGQLGNAIKYFFMTHFNMTEERAFETYHSLIRSNYYEIIAISFLILFAFGMWVLISRFMHYVDKMSAGMDQVIIESKKEIRLPDELDFMENKLKEYQMILEKREGDLKLAEQKKNDLVVYLAHDIKTPLTSVLGYLDLLYEAPDMPEEQKRKYIKITYDKALRLEKLINEFFEITRYNLQAIPLNKTEIDLYYLFVQMSEEFYPMLEPYGKRIVLDMDETISVFGDSDKLARVFNNILKNAVAYSEENSAIHIMAERKENKTEIRIQNKGITIPKEKLDTIFDKFYRLDEARTSDTGGAGLGLAIAKEIVTLHGGVIEAESEDGITTFCVKI